MRWQRRNDQSHNKRMQDISTEEVQGETQLGRQGDPREMCRKFQFDHTIKWCIHNPAPVIENDSHKLLWDFNIKTDHLIPSRRPDLIIINKKRENLQNCWLTCLGRPQNESEGKWKEEWVPRPCSRIKKAVEHELTIVPIVIGALGTVTKGLLKGLENLEVGGRVETIQWQHCWGRPEYWDESWRLEETCCHSNSSKKPSANTDVKNSKGVNNNNNVLIIRKEIFIYLDTIKALEISLIWF